MRASHGLYQTADTTCDALSGWGGYVALRGLTFRRERLKNLNDRDGITTLVVLLGMWM